MTITPKKKVAAGGIGGSLSLLLVWAASQYGIPLTPEVASAVTAVVGFIFGWLKSD